MPRNIQHEINKLKKMILSLSSLVEDSVNKASASVLNVSKEDAELVIQNDEKIDEMEIEVEEECLKILALHQPVATDLRYIVAIIKINDELERIGDLAVNIAERTLSLTECDKVEIGFDFTKMTEKVTNMLNKSINSLVQFDEKSAHEVLHLDEEIDTIHSQMYVKLREIVNTNTNLLTTGMHYLSVSKHLERIADHAESIAENVIYMIGGEIIRHTHSSNSI
jgi:phosphate transport system protein